MIDLKQALLLIEEYQFTWIKVKNTKGLVFLSRPRSKETFTTKDMIGFLKKMSTDYPGVYVLELKRNPTEPDKNTHTWEVDMRNSEVVETNPGTFTEADIDKRVNEILAAKEAEYENEDLKAELLEMKTLSGKANYMLMDFFKGFMNKNTPTVQLQGESGGNLGAAVIPTDSKTELDETNKLLLKHFDADTLLRLAKKIDTNPDLVTQIKSLLNI